MTDLNKTKRIAIVLLNLGGPDSLSAVRPFLQNLFSDPAILRVPAPLRWLLARLIAQRRAPIAQQIYTQMGGRSPILANTEAQARALESALGAGYRCFIAMRYWHPRAEAVAREVNEYQPDAVILLPLYPQYSTTTSASSLAEFTAALAAYPRFQTNAVKIKPIQCYPCNDGYIYAMAALIRPQLEAAAKHGKPRLLLSAHGLPVKVIKAGDPYQWQCEQTARALVAALAWPDLDWRNCYQSRVGPMAWIKPATADEIRRAGAEHVPVVLAPIAFVSEHSETLVELDIEYKELAHEAGVPFYGRVPTVGAHPDFIDGLAKLVHKAQTGSEAPRLCPPEFTHCPCRP